jgi:hypothetical protein
MAGLVPTHLQRGGIAHLSNKHQITMSVEFYPVISTESTLREKLEDGDFLELAFEEESIPIEELPTQSHISADFLSSYDQFASALPAATQTAFEQFADIVCWDYRDTPQPLDSSFQPEGIHFSCSPATCGRLAASISSIDQGAVRRAFVAESMVPTADFFLKYLEAWREIFRRASESNQFVFAFIP